MKITRFAGSVAGLMLWLVTATTATPQDKSKYFTNMHPDRFAIDWIGFYNEADKRTAEVRAEYPHHLDLPFGDDPKQRLDLYFPKGSVRDAPIFLFLHGGGFREGDRAHYGFVARPLADNGIITAVTSYRLTTDGFHYPDQSNDVEESIVWLYRNVARYGGNPNRIFVGGHSAGAILSAFVAVRQHWLRERGIPEDIIRGSAPISGPYDLRPGAYEARSGEADAYVNRAELAAEASPILRIEKAPPKNVVALGALEPKYLESSKLFVEALKEKGARVEFFFLEGMDHNHTALALGDAESELTQAILRMIKDDN